MRYLVVSCSLLAFLLAASLWNAHFVEAETESWRETVEDSVEAAERRDWEAAARLIREAREEWDTRKPYLHVVTAHDELDKVDVLFAEAESFAVEHDMGEFRAEAAELAVQLGIIAEMQKMTVRNIL